MAWNFGDEVQFGGGECHGARYITHFYCLAVEAGFNSDLGSIPGLGQVKYFHSTTPICLVTRRWPCKCWDLLGINVQMQLFNVLYVFGIRYHTSGECHGEKT